MESERETESKEMVPEQIQSPIRGSHFESAGVLVSTKRRGCLHLLQKDLNAQFRFLHPLHSQSPSLPSPIRLLRQKSKSSGSQCPDLYIYSCTVQVKFRDNQAKSMRCVVVVMQFSSFRQLSIDNNGVSIPGSRDFKGDTFTADHRTSITLLRLRYIIYTRVHMGSFNNSGLPLQSTSTQTFNYFFGPDTTFLLNTP